MIRLGAIFGRKQALPHAPPAIVGEQALANQARIAIAMHDVRSGQQDGTLLEERSNFLATLSHELRTPLNAIVGYAELLMSPQGEAVPSATRREYAGHILGGARNLQRLIDDVLDATRIQNGTLTITDQQSDFSELAEVAIRTVQDQAEAYGVTIVANLVPGITVTGDSQRLQQVVRNLLSNAIKFSPSGGTIAVDMQRTSSGQLVLLVKDEGIGIRSTDLGRVFDPFVQIDEGTTRRFGGAGLGLTISRHIALLHGGDIVLRSEDGSGTEARLLIPERRVMWPPAQKRSAAG